MWWWPRHNLESGWPIDAEEVNENLRDVVAHMEGRLGEHEWNAAAITARGDVAANGYAIVYRAITAVNPILDIVILPGPIIAGAVGAFRASISGSWQVVTAMSLPSVDTGNSLCWVIASFQQAKYMSTGDVFNGLQHAIRIDGQIIPETITGTLDVTNDRFGQGCELTNGAIATIAGTGTFSPDLQITLSPGRHLVELVVNTPLAQTTLPVLGTDFYELWNRELIVIVFDPSGTDGTGAGVSVNPIQEGAAIAAASLNAPLAAIATEMNALDYTAVAPESLHDQHLPTPIIASGSLSISDGATHTYTNDYAGYGLTGVASAAPAGWLVLSQGGTDLSLTFASVDLADADTRGILVHFNGLVRRIEVIAGAVDRRYYAVFGLEVRDTANNTFVIGRTERIVNAEVDGVVQLAVFRDVSIRTMITAADLGATKTVNRVRALVSTANWTLVGDETVTMGECNLTIAALQAG